MWARQNRSVAILYLLTIFGIVWKPEAVGLCPWRSLGHVRSSKRLFPVELRT